jgi:ligand-binding sensor domain-containing protein
MNKRETPLFRYSFKAFPYSALLIWFILNIAFLLSSLSLWAQLVKPKPVLKHFIVDNGLPSNETYHIIQDSIGYLWIATANGVSRFDGSNFKNYGLEDGLVDNTIYEIFSDYKGRLWFVSSSGKLASLENGMIKPYPFNHRISDHLPGSRGPIKKSFFVDTLDNVHLSLKHFGRIKISKDGVYKESDGIHKEGEVVVEMLSNGTVLISNPLNAPTYDLIIINGEKTYRFTSIELVGGNHFLHHFFFLPVKDDHYIVTQKGNLIRIINGKIIERKNLGSEIIWASIDQHNNLWVAPIEGGVYRFSNADFINDEVQFFMEGIKVTSVLEDREGGYWFSTLTHGIFYCPNISFQNFDEGTNLPNSRISSVFVNRKGVFIGYEIGVVSLISGSKITNYSLGGIKSSSMSIRSIGIDSTSKTTWVCSNYFIHEIDNDGVNEHRYNQSYFGIYPREMIPDRAGGFWIATVKGLLKFNGKEILYDSNDASEFSAVIYSLFQDSHGELWLGTINGLWKYKGGIYSYIGYDNPIFSYQINSISATADGTILLGTRGIGLILVKEGAVHQITQSDGLASNSIKKIFVEESGIWLATNNGLSWIKNWGKDISIQNINISHGLPTNDVNSVFVRGNQVYAATSMGLTVFDKRMVGHNMVKPKCWVINVRVNNMDTDFRSNALYLKYNQNFIIIDYVGLAFRNMGKVFYRYRLLGLDSQWVYTNSTNSIFSGLSQGEYTYEVQAQNSDGLWGDSSKIDIKISPPFWKRFWFNGLTTILFSTLLYLVYRTRVRAIRKRNDTINSINIYKQQSLRQQMNPHFIFNTLNSIQLYILEKDHISSHKYLAKFARLIRMTLDNSQNQSSSLQNEIEALKLYLELESLRLEGKFQYSIEIESNELLEKEVPSLLIQPFVENAIWHGIMLKPDQEGWVKIIVRSQNDIIKCIIEDNGVGRKVAQSIREKRSAEHKSLGYKITAQRIELLNTLYSGQFNIIYTDLCLPNGEATGTRVELTIPCIVNK